MEDSVLRQTCITVGILSVLTHDCCKSSRKDLFWTQSVGMRIAFI